MIYGFLLGLALGAFAGFVARDIVVTFGSQPRRGGYIGGGGPER